MTLFTDDPFEKMMIQKPDYGSVIIRRLFLPRLRVLLLQGAVSLCGVLYQKTGNQTTDRTIKGGFIIDFSYGRKAQCGTDNRCRTWGKGKERRISHRKRLYRFLVCGTLVGLSGSCRLRKVMKNGGLSTVADFRAEMECSTWLLKEKQFKT